MFLAIVADLGLDDTQSGVAMSRLAGATADPSLAVAIERVANAFFRRAPQISSSEVQALCR